MTGLRIGFVGCGLIARHHAANLRGDDRAQIVAVHDLDADRARRFATEHCPDGDAAVCSGLDQVVERSDAVYVCTWTSAHPEAVLAAASAGRAVFCEKPLATTLAEAESITQAVSQAGVTNQVGLVLRASPAFRWLRHQANRAEAGPIMNLIFRDDQYIPIQGMYGSTWRQDVTRAGGGTLLEHSIHDLDLIEWILGPIVEVSARMGSVHGLDGIDDQTTATLVAQSGAQAALVSIWHDVLTRPSQRRVEVFARHRYFALEGDHDGPVRWEGRGPDGADDAEPSSGELSGSALVAAATAIDGLHGTPDRRFVTAALDGSAASPDLATALRAHRLADAAYRSAADGGWPIPVGGVV